MQSVNEELQSSNEELQTSKEETQSLNEELHTVNAELTQKLQALEQANDDLLNLMNNIEIATIFLDDLLRVKRFTPQARSVARLIDADVGRPLADLAILLDYPDLLSDATSVLQSLRPLEKQVTAPDGSWYAVRIRPYRTARNAVEGLVVTFIDITQTKHAERVEAARVVADTLVDAVREPLLVLDGALRVVRANDSFYQLFRVEPSETHRKLVYELGSGQWNIPGLRDRLERTLHGESGFDGFEVDCEFPQIGVRRMVLDARGVSMKDGRTAELIVLGIEHAPETAPRSLVDVSGTTLMSKPSRSRSLRQLAERKMPRSVPTDLDCPHGRRDPAARPRAGGPQSRAGDPERAAEGDPAGGGGIEGAIPTALRLGADRVSHARSQGSDPRGQPDRVPTAAASRAHA